MEPRLRHFLTLLVAAVLGAGPAVSSGAEKKDTRPVLDPPPPAMPQNFVVARGQKVEVPLKIYGKRGESLRFQIKAGPLFGRLSDLRAVSREAWSVTYEPPADLKVKADRFSFAVQSSAGVSAPAEVTFTITDEPPVLAVPHTVDFGEILAGGTVVKEIEIANRGGGVITGEVKATEPFRIEGRTTYRLEKNDYAYFKVVFAPVTGGAFRGEVSYSSDREFVTGLVGRSQMPVSAEPAKVELRQAPTTPARAGGFELVNRTEQELTFEIKGPTRLKFPASVTVPANGRTTVAVSTTADDVKELDETVRVESAGFSLAVPVHGMKVGPMLSVSPARLALGRVDATRGAQGAVEVRNIGGTGTRVTVESTAPFVVDAKTFDLVPGATRLVGIQLPPGDPKRYRAWLRFKGAASPVEVEVEGELLGEMAAGSVADSAEKKKATPKPADVEPWMPDLNLAKAIRVTNITASGADLEWPADMNGAPKFLCQRLMLTRDSAKRLRHAWVDVPKATFSRRGSQIVASLSGLQPAQSQTIRVVPIDLQGAMGAEMFRYDFYTAPKPALPRPKLIPSLFVALLVVIGILAWKRVRHRFTAPISGF